MNPNYASIYESYNIKVLKAGIQLIRYIIACFLSLIGYNLIALQYFGENKDWSVYSRYYDYFINGIGAQLTQVEPIFHIIFSIASSWHADLLTVLASVAAVSLLIKLIIITKISRSVLPLIAYSVAMFPLHEYTQIRVALALAFCYLYIFICSKYKKTSYVLLALIPLIHTSCMLFVLFCLFGNKLYSLSFKRSLFLSLAVLLIISIGIQFVAILLGSSNLVNYLTGEVVEKKPVVFSITNIIFFLYSMSFLYTGVQYKDKGVYLSALVSFLSVPIAFIFYSYPVLADRFKELFFSFGVITFAYLLRYFKYRVSYFVSFFLYILFCASSLFVYLNNGLLFR